MESRNRVNLTAVESPLEMVLTAASLIPITHHLLGFSLILIAFLYNFLEIHFLQDLFTGFRGQPVVLTIDPCSQLYRDVVSKCKTLHGRHIFMTSDGGTLALDWVKNAQVKGQAFQVDGPAQKDGENPILIIVPGLTSASDSAYVKHLAFIMAKRGWNVVVSNHRGLGGVSITSDCFYNGGWTEDVRNVINHIHCQYPEAPLYVVGTSIGANILIKFLAEDGINAPVVGAAAICSPWDLLICDRFMSRKLIQRLYNKALAVGLKDYAQMHEAVLSRISNWEGIQKSRSVRDFDDSATRVLGNYETVDTYYRRCSSANFVGSVMVPLLCVSALDDPICTREAIPWDECRLNKNVVLATTEHGGHLPFFEGITATSVWWARAVDEFFSILQSSPRKIEISVPSVNPGESSIDQAPYVHLSQDGTVGGVSDETQVEHKEQNKAGDRIHVELNQPPNTDQGMAAIVAPVMKRLNQLSRQNRTSLWVLAYIAFLTTWPLVGSAVSVFFRRRFHARFSSP
ncbi:embryogenesis-associated protein EMB8-like [Salvia divinorum]|uniref:Embryogenesis-associated protein EMB8-like n=1 Tax=Salvia divinorum TaxID=28513 RepID=A0ABD1GZR0_SALDI